MKRLLAPAILLLLISAGAVSAIAARGDQAGTRQHPLLVIRPEVVGCHSWSLNGGDYKLDQTVRLREGDSLQVVNRDICTHTLVKTAGGELSFHQFQAETPMGAGEAPQAADLTGTVLSAKMPIFPEPTGEAAMPAPVESGEMAQYGAGVTATFDEAGSYNLITEEGASYFPGGVQTIGPDNTLTLHVLVYPPIDHPLP